MLDLRMNEKFSLILQSVLKIKGEMTIRNFPLSLSYQYSSIWFEDSRDVVIDKMSHMRIVSICVCASGHHHCSFCICAKVEHSLCLLLLSVPWRLLISNIVFQIDVKADTDHHFLFIHRERSFWHVVSNKETETNGKRNNFSLMNSRKMYERWLWYGDLSKLIGKYSSSFFT